MLSEKLSSQLLSIPEFFSLGWSVFKNNLLTILYLVLSVQVPLQIIQYYLDNDYLSIISTSAIGIFQLMGIAYIVDRQIKDETVSIMDVYTKLLHLWPAGIFAYFLSLLIIFGMSLLLLIPGLVWYIYYIFVLSVVVLREKRWKSALDYSKSLVVGRWWTVFGYKIVFTLLIAPFILIYLQTNRYTSVATTSIAIAYVIGAYSNVLSVLLFINLDNLKQAEATAAQGPAASDVIPQFIRPEILSK